MLPSYIKGLESRKICGKGKPASPPKKEQQPRKVCTICAKLFDFGDPESIIITPEIKAPTTLESAVCEDCQKSLDEGYVGLVEGTRYAFVKSERLADMAGKIVQVKKKTMDELQKQHQQVRNRRVPGASE